MFHKRHLGREELRLQIPNEVAIVCLHSYVCPSLLYCY